MCRGFQQSERDRLRIKAFYIHLSCTTKGSTLPDFLTLHYLPRINGTLLEINGSTIRPDAPAFVTLHRVWTSGNEKKGVVYGCKERISVCEGVRFEVYFGDVKFLKGVFRKDYGEDGEEGDGNWGMGCKCDEVLEGVKGAEVAVAVEGGVTVNEKVEMVAKRRMGRRKCCELEEIPEVREEGEYYDVCRCSECCGEADEEDDDEEENVEEMEMEMEGVRWAVDVGIWVVCIGVGYLASKRFRKGNRFIL